MSALTEAQSQAAERAYDILREHFDASLIVVLATTGADDHQEASRVFWHGGRTLALGLATEAKDRILHKPPDEHES